MSKLGLHWKREKKESSGLQGRFDLRAALSPLSAAQDSPVIDPRVPFTRLTSTQYYAAASACSVCLLGISSDSKRHRPGGRRRGASRAAPTGQVRSGSLELPLPRPLPDRGGGLPVLQDLRAPLSLSVDLNGMEPPKLLTPANESSLFFYVRRYDESRRGSYPSVPPKTE